jgi:spermidine/putrescine ABC transporter ATP-binding subunit
MVGGEPLEGQRVLVAVDHSVNAAPRGHGLAPAIEHADARAAGSASNKEGAVELQRITKRYGEDRVVEDVSLDIRPGEFFSLLGPSGSGKTTTLMMIAGFASVDEGSILVDGGDIVATPPQRRGFGMVFQNYAIFPHMNVFENVAFPLRARRLAQNEINSRVAWALGLVRLEAFADRFARQLSGGQQQRVAIARAIVFHPKVVLMDEPLGALDKNLRYDMQVEIKEIQRRLGMTVVYVTHDQEEAMNMSDRIAIMNRGRIEQVGIPSEIYERPANIFIARFLGEANLIPGRIERVAQGVATLRAADNLDLRARAPQGLERGHSASLFVRPERLAIAAAAAPAGPAENRLAGSVRRISFLGHIVRYMIEVAPSVALTVDVQNTGAPRLGIGECAGISWAVEDSTILVQ